MYLSLGDIVNSQEREQRAAEIFSELERLQIEYAILSNRRVSLVAELQQITQIRNRLRNLSKAAPYAPAGGGTQLNMQS